MTENRQVVVATIMLLPAIAAAMTAVSLLSGTLSSFPLLFVGFTLSVFGLFLYFVIPIGAFLALIHVGKDRLRLHLASIVVFGLAVALCGAWIVASWSYGERYQGYGTTYLLAALNAATVLALIVPLVANRRHPTFRSRVMFNWLLVVWLFSWAFPYLGEYP